MKKLSKILFLLVIMSAGLFTSCIDYVDTTLPLYPTWAAASANTQFFDNTVRGYTYYSKAENKGNGYSFQEKIAFNVSNHTFIKQILTWGNGELGTSSNDKRIDVVYGQYGVKNGGELVYRITDSSYRNPLQNSNVSTYAFTGTGIITLHGKKYVIRDLFDKAGGEGYNDHNW